MRQHPSHHRSRPVRTVPLAATAAVVALACATAGALANTVVDLRWAADPSGATVVTVTADRELDAADYRAYPLTLPPRAVLVIRGVDRPLDPATVEIGDRHLVRVRSGLHRDRPTPELHLVFDLPDDGVEILEVGHRGAELRIVFGRRPAGDGRAPSPAAASSRPIPVLPSPTATPTSPPPTVAPTGPLPDPPSHEPSVAPGNVVPSPLVAPAPPEPAARVTEIGASARGDGSTLLLIIADGRLADGCARVIEVADDPARIVLTLRGLRAPDLPRNLEIGDPILERVRLVHDAETSNGELHLVLHLSDGGVTVTDLNQVGAHLVVRLARPGSGEPDR